jgi:hypothetical protein
MTALRSTPDAPASFSSPERAALADAIDRHRQLAAHLDDVRKRAQAGSDARLSEAYKSRSAAEAALKDAQSSAGSSALARSLGDAGAGKSVATLQAELKASRDHFDAVWSDRELVQGEIGRISVAVDNARRTRDEAVSKVLASAPGWCSLLAELPLARRRVQDLENLFDALSRVPGTKMPNHWDTPLLRSQPDDWQPDPALAETWRAAITALSIDATAFRPGEGMAGRSAVAAGPLLRASLRRLVRARAPVALAPAAGAAVRWRGHGGTVARLDGAHAVVEFDGRLWRVPISELE